MTQGEPGVVIIFFYFFAKQRGKQGGKSSAPAKAVAFSFGKQGGFDYGYECMVPYGCSVSIFYAMWICYGGGWFYQIKECW